MKNGFMLGVIVLWVLGSVSCATVGKPIDKSKMDQIENGKTTQAQIETWFGEPHEKYTSQKTLAGHPGSVLAYNYTFAEGTAAGATRIEILLVFFDKEQRVLHASYTEQ